MAVADFAPVPCSRNRFPIEEFSFGLLSEYGLFEREVKIVLQIVAAFGSCAAAGLTEKILENIVEDIAEATLTAEIKASPRLVAHPHGRRYRIVVFYPGR